jgi:hypothetical protein
MITNNIILLPFLVHFLCYQIRYYSFLFSFFHENVTHSFGNMEIIPRHPNFHGTLTTNCIGDRINFIVDIVQLMYTFGSIWKR